MIDEISIKKHVEWVGNRFSGYIDLGTDLDDDLLLPAKETFTFMLNSINGNQKVPIGYFLINGLSADVRGSLFGT